MHVGGPDRLHRVVLVVPGAVPADGRARCSGPCATPASRRSASIPPPSSAATAWSTPCIPSAPSLLGGVAGYDDLTTPFVELPDAVRIACVESGGYGYLGVDLAATPGDVRQLDGLIEQRIGPTWGLHLLDANLAQDALIELAARQAAARPGPP